MSEVVTAPQQAAPAAPQAAPAAPQAAPTTPAAPQAAEAPKTWDAPNPNTDPEGHSAWLSKQEANDPMSVQEYFEAVARGEIKHPSEAVASAPAQPQGEQVADAGIQPPPAAPETTPGEPAPLTQEQFDALPENVQDVLLAMQEQAKQSQVNEWTPLAERGITPAALERIMSDPIVQLQAQRLATGKAVEIPEEVASAVQPDVWLDLAADKLANLNFAEDPEGTRQAVKEILESALPVAAEAGVAKLKYEMQQREIANQNKAWAEKELGQLASKNPALQSSLDYSDPNHPIAPFINHLNEMKQAGMSFDAIKKMGMESLWVAYQAKLGGGFTNVYKQAMAAQKKSLLEGIQKKARAALTSVGSDTTAGQTSHTVRFGIDGAKYLSDPAYAQTVFETAMDKANLEGDSTLWSELMFLRANGRWRQ
jgi:hypothetical protein